MPYLSGDKPGDPHDALFWRFWGQSAIREGRWKLIELESGTRMLFDMETDAQENQNVIEQHPEIAKRLQKKLADWRDVQRRPGFVEKFGQEAAWYKHYFGVK